MGSFLEEASDLLLEQSADEPHNVKEEIEEGENIILNDEEKEPLLSDDALKRDIDDGDEDPEETKASDESKEPTMMEDDNRSDDDDTKSQVAEDNVKEDKEVRDSEEFHAEDDPKKEDDAEAGSAASNKAKDKENAETKSSGEENNKNDTAIAQDFRFGTRGEVNGAALVFGVTALLIAGPVIALVGAAAAAHIAANKPCKCAEFTRRSGGVVDNIGKKKRLERAAKRVEEGAEAPKPHLWDKITDRLVEGGQWTEQIIIPGRRGRRSCRRPRPGHGLGRKAPPPRAFEWGEGEPESHHSEANTQLDLI